MVKGQNVEKVGSRVIYLVLSVVVLDAHRARPLSEVDGQAVTKRKNVSSVDLKNWTVDLRAQLIYGAALQGLRRLSELQVQTRTEAAAGANIGSAF